MIRLTKIKWDIFYSVDTIKERDCIEKSLSYYNPDSIYSRSDYWDGYNRYYDRRKKCFNFGHISHVINKILQSDLDYELSGLDYDIFVPDTKYNKSLRPHQIAALYSFFKTKHGIIQIPTRGGKTYFASEAIRLINHKNAENITLFIVDTQMLFNQAIKDISEYLNIDKSDIGYIKDGEIITKQINVATIQSISSIYFGVKRIRKTYTKNKEVCYKTSGEIKIERKEKRMKSKQLLKFLSEVGFLIVDECHEYSSDDRVKIVKSVENSDFNLFMSATPFKSDNVFSNISLRGIAGDILYEIPEKDLKKDGYLAKDKIILIRIKHDRNKYINWDKLVSYHDFVNKVIINNNERNQLIINIIEICRRQQLKTLVLFSFKNHGYNISNITDDKYLTGDDKIGDREFFKNKFLKEKGGVLLASNIFNKGLTLPEVEVMINIGGGKEKSNIIQKKGRVLGTTDDKKKALIIDFIDESEYFSEHSLSRLEVYEESVESDDIIVFDSTDVNFYKEIKEYIKEWFDEGIV